jgi:hypothetical protein
VHGCVRACAVACARDGCVRARLRACVRVYVLPACVCPSRFTILFVPHTHCSLYRTTRCFLSRLNIGIYFSRVPTVRYPTFFIRLVPHDKTKLHPFRACVRACVPACVCMCCGSSADPFAALVISTPVYNFILNSETTYSYLFILLKNSIGTHLELLKFSISLAVPSLVFARKTCVCLYVPYMSSFNTNFKTFLFPCAHTDEIH